MTANDRLRDATFVSGLQQCVHCGLCLPACPTYHVFHTEMDAPRGRLALMAAASEGRVPLDGALRLHLDRCLGCRACETVCPSGVPYGALLETARLAIEAERTPSTAERLVRRLALHELLPRVDRLRRLALVTRGLQQVGLFKLADHLPLSLDRIKRMAALLPPEISTEFTRPGVYPPVGERRGRVAFFMGCVQEALLAHVNAATVRVLQHNGYEVHVVPGQTCCGAVAYHLGDEATAVELAKHNVAAFAGDYEAIINNAGGCGAMLKEYAALLGDGRAREFVARVQDVTEFLAERLHHAPTNPVPGRVTYVDSCHLRHAQRVVGPPRRLLAAIPGLELVELSRPDHCCGSAGVYNLLHPETAEIILDAKMADVAQTQATFVATTNTGCYLQVLYGVRRWALDARVVHVVELLDMAYGAGRKAS
ncbi:MAG: (Fe-S)-binding protein [Ardenticatenia bacterium]|nr:(Fe-S)-binding protein [Ardenticatenia bacterium]